MATLKIEIDTESTDRKPSQDLRPMTAKLRIGLASSIRITQDLKKAFEDGVHNGGIQIHPKKDNLRYKKNEKSNLVNAIKQHFNTDHLLVTFGGLVTYEAAHLADVTEFVSVVGNEPSTLHGRCWGGVSLECINSNANRLEYLNLDKQIPIANIYLFYNENSEMNANYDEVNEWNSLVGANTQIVSGGTNANGDNDYTVYTQNFQQINGDANIRGIIISSDPYFQDTKQALVAAANTWLQNGTNRYICYPSRTYRAASPRAGQSTVFGPSMKEAYFLAGQVAVRAMTAGKQPFVRILNEPDDI
jgi:hypothetical protein